jgi:aspartate carbamoyltransferase catalytic subunit
VLQQVSNGVHVRMAVLFNLLVGTESAGKGLAGKGLAGNEGVA